MEGIPEWVLWVGSGFGAMMAAFVARMGWKSAGGQKQSGQSAVMLDGALVDSGSINRLTAAVEARALQDMENRKCTHEMIETVQDLTKELSEIRNEMRFKRR